MLDDLRELGEQAVIPVADDVARSLRFVLTGFAEQFLQVIEVQQIPRRDVVVVAVTHLRGIFSRCEQTSKMTPLLAQALVALTVAQAPEAASAEALRVAFDAAIVRMDDADRAYVAAIERILPPAKAAEMVAAMTAFRDDVYALRARTRAETGYGDFDPLDTYVPSLAVSHGQSVRIANAADLARGHVAVLRAKVNASIGALLEREEIDRLTEAKRQRNAAFDAAIRAAVPRGTSDRLGTLLLVLAESWY